MSSSATAAAGTAPPQTTLPVLARSEMRRYLRHPLFAFGVALTLIISALGPDGRTSTLFHAIVPAAAFGVLGIIVMAALVRSSESMRSAAGAVPVPERTANLALVAACLVPFAAGLAWWVWAVGTYRRDTVPPDGFPFGPVGDAWVATVLFTLGPVASFGGPLLGLLVGRWIGGRAAPVVAAVAVVAATIVMQGLIEPLRRIRVVMPWTYWGGPGGAESDPERMLLFSGSVYWWTVYVVCLCGLGVIAALLHDREQPRRRLVVAAGAVGCVALVTVLLAMFTGIPETIVNPVPAPPP